MLVSLDGDGRGRGRGGKYGLSLVVVVASRLESHLGTEWRGGRAANITVARCSLR